MRKFKVMRRFTVNLLTNYVCIVDGTKNKYKTHASRTYDQSMVNVGYLQGDNLAYCQLLSNIVSEVVAF